VRELSPFGTVLFRSYQQALSGLSSLSCSPFRLSRNRRGVSTPRTRASPHACSRRWPRLLGHGGFRRCSPSELHAAPLEGFEPAQRRFAPVHDGQPADRRLRVVRQVCPRRPDSSGNNHEVEAWDCSARRAALLQTALLEPGVHVSVHRALRVYEGRSCERRGWSGRVLAPGWSPGLAGLVSHLDGVRVVLVAPRTENRGNRTVFDRHDRSITEPRACQQAGAGLFVGAEWRAMRGRARRWPPETARSRRVPRGARGWSTGGVAVRWRRRHS
jgi:hypothetical protein